MNLRLILTAVAAASAAHLVSMPFFRSAGHPMPPSLFASQLIVIVLFQLLASIATGHFFQRRLWAVAGYAFPVFLSLWHFVDPVLGNLGLLLVFSASISAAVLWAARSSAAGRPVFFAAIGSLAGGLLNLLRHEGPSMLKAGAGGLVTSCLIALVVFVAAAVASRRIGSPRALRVRTVLGAIVFVWIGAALIGRAELVPPTPTPPEGKDFQKRPSIVLIVLDTLAPRHLGSRGYERDTMPYLDAFAREECVDFTRAYATGSYSLSTHASLFTGLYPPRHGSHYPYLEDPNPPRIGYPMRKDVTTLAETLADAGYWTVGISANYGPLGDPLGFGRGFDYYRADEAASPQLKQRSTWWLQARLFFMLEFLNALPPFRECEYFGRGVGYPRGSEITSQALRVAEAAQGKPLFLFLNYYDVHKPYYAPPGYRGRLLKDVTRLGDGFLRHEPDVEIMSGERDIKPAEREFLKAIYDEELMYLDDEMKRLIERLREILDFSSTMVVITADHGEAFGEHRSLRHSRTLYNEMLHIPLFIKPGSATPGAPPVGSEIDDLIQIHDIHPTLLLHAGLPVPEGIDAVPWGEGREDARAWFYMSPGDVKRYGERYDRELRAIIWEDWKLIESTADPVELYNLKEDPLELRNLADENPEVRDMLLERLGPKEEIDLRHVNTDDLPEETLRKLRALGYID